MSRQPLGASSLAELSERFETLCVAQYHSIEREEIAVFNRRYREIEAIIGELKSRQGDQRRILTRFFGHPNPQVRLTAAHANLPIDYSRARAVFENIATHEFGSQKLDAGMTLSNLDSGFYRPT